MARALNPDSLLPLLRTLCDGAWHSGARLAREAGVTRAALSKRVHRLLDLGLEIETQPGRGCRLVQPLDLLEPDLVRGALAPAWQDRLALRVLASTDSTNTRLIESDPAHDPQALLAEHQTRGRGRQGRAWHSPFGTNLYLSLAWSFAQWPPQLTALSLAAGVAVAEALEALGVADVQLKWPNDLWRHEAKLGGILIEQRGEAGGACRVVLGLGLNVSMRTATEAQISQPWTSLAEALSGRAPSRNLLAAKLLERWCAMLERFADEGFAPFLPGWRARDLTRNRAVRVEQDAQEIEGIARGVDDDGGLLLDVAGARRRILSGDVRLRPQSGTP